jgi:hypothetical protein
MVELTELLENDERYSLAKPVDGQASLPFYSGTVFAAGQSAVVFTSPTTIEALTMTEEIQMDGTFDAVPVNPPTLAQLILIAVFLYGRVSRKLFTLFSNCVF